MANPSNSMNANESSIDTIILHDKSVKSPQDHTQTTSNLHISITNDTKPVLFANTTSDSVTSSKFADNEDSYNEEPEIKTNDPDKNPSPDIFAEEHQPQLQHDPSADTYNEHEIESNNSDSDRTLTAPDPTSFYRQNSDTFDTYDTFTGTRSGIIDDECDYYGQEEEEKSYHPSLDEDHDQIAAVNVNQPSPPPSPGHSKRPTFDHEDDHKLYDEDDEDDQKLAVLDPKPLDIAKQSGLNRDCKNIMLFQRIKEFQKKRKEAKYDEEDEKNPVLTADNLRTHNGSPHSQQRPSAETLHRIVNHNDSAPPLSSGSQSPPKSSSRHSSRTQLQLTAIMEELEDKGELEHIEVDSKYEEVRQESVHINWYSISTPTASNAGSNVDTGIIISDISGTQLAVVTMGFLYRFFKFIDIIEIFKPFLDRKSEGNHDIMAMIIRYYPRNEHLEDLAIPGRYKLAENKAGHVRSGSEQSHLSGGPAWNYDEIKKVCTNTDGEYVESDTNSMNQNTESPLAMKARRSISYEPAAANYAPLREDEENGLTLEDWEDDDVDADDEEFSEDEKGDSDDEVVSDMITQGGDGNNNALTIYQDGSRASIFISQATGHDSNHDELNNDISMEHEDPPSTTNEAADEEVNEDSNDVIDEHDNDDDMELDLSGMVASGDDDHDHNTQQYASLVEPDAILRHITDVTEEDIEQEEEEEPQEDNQPINQPLDPYFDPSLINFDYNGNLLDAHNEQFIQTTKEDDDYPDNYY